jgi:hypothetical protein
MLCWSIKPWTGAICSDRLSGYYLSTVLAICSTVSCDFPGGAPRAVKRAGPVLRPQRRAGLDTWRFMADWLLVLLLADQKAYRLEHPIHLDW